MEFTSTVVEGLPYRTVQKLGQGRFGEVFLISHLRNSDITAVVKILDVEKVKEEEILEEFHLQRRLSRAGHENVLNMFWMHRTDEFYHLVMEDVEGDNLADRCLRTGRMRPAMAHHLFKQLMAGLKFIHGRGIVHGDIKPHNLLVTKKNLLKIIDFGAAVLYRLGSQEELIRLKTRTRAFAAPEVFTRGTVYKGPPVDIWSSGVTLLSMLSGGMIWDQADYKIQCYRHWVERRSTIEWSHIEKPAMHLLRQMITNCVARWTMEEIEKSEWMQADYGPIRKIRRKPLEEL